MALYRDASFKAIQLAEGPLSPLEIKNMQTEITHSYMVLLRCVSVDFLIYSYIAAIPAEVQAILVKSTRYLDNFLSYLSLVIAPHLCLFRKWRYCDA